ncbi:MAG: two-component system response regulator [Candidatus Xenobiia bacterium LiM19]
MMTDPYSEEKVNILLVDDEKVYLEVLKAFLSDLGHTIVLANSGMECLKYIEEMDFAVVVLDVSMPGMDGFETARRIFESSRAKDVSILFLTAIARESIKIFEGFSLGAVDYLFKPCESSVFIAKVKVFVQLYQQKRALQRLNRELEQKVAELTDAVTHIRTLHGMLPICAGCKKIRGDGNTWQPIVSYLRERSVVDFTHTICPECTARLYPGLHIDDDQP